MHTKVWAVAAAALLLTGCGSPKPESPTGGATGARQLVGSPDVSNIKISGDASDPVNKLAIQALEDLQQYWSQEFPRLYGKEFEPVSGGYYAVYPSNGDLPPCATEPSDIELNAFYCASEDVMAWDAEELFPGLKEKFGDFVIPIVLAHEYGHAVQARSNFAARTVTSELQADCFAGTWSKHAQEDGVFDVDTVGLDNALAGILEFRDTPGASKIDPDAHGSGFDRVSAFQDGYDGGPTKCKAYRDDDPMVFELPFNDRVDEAREGDAPYDYVVNTVPYDLEDYWTQVYPVVTGGEQWEPVRGLEPYHPGDPPMCGDQSAKGYVMLYCATDDYVGWDNEVAMPTIYQKAGDYAVATLLASQYGLAALTRLDDQSDERTSSLRGDCLAGSYTASVLLYNRPDTSTYQISPGDLDEGIKALLVFRGKGDRERQGTGFARVRAFREGVLNGAQPCLDYQPQ